MQRCTCSRRTYKIKNRATGFAWHTFTPSSLSVLSQRVAGRSVLQHVISGVYWWYSAHHFKPTPGGTNTQALTHPEHARSRRETHQAPTMHAFLSEQPPDATNETAFANDQRMNTLDHAMPVRTQSHHAPHTTHTPRRASPRQAVPARAESGAQPQTNPTTPHPSRCVLTPCYRTGAREAERPEAVRCELRFGKACFALVSVPPHNDIPTCDPYSINNSSCPQTRDEPPSPR